MKRSRWLARDVWGEVNLTCAIEFPIDNTEFFVPSRTCVRIGSIFLKRYNDNSL